MSMHKIPLTPIEESGLKAHGLDIGVPSQLSDVFRQGVAWGLKERQEPTLLSEDRLEAMAIDDEFLLYCDQDEFNQIARAVEREVLKTNLIGGKK